MESQAVADTIMSLAASHGMVAKIIECDDDRVEARISRKLSGGWQFVGEIEIYEDVDDADYIDSEDEDALAPIARNVRAERRASIVSRIADAAVEAAR